MVARSPEMMVGGAEGRRPLVRIGAITLSRDALALVGVLAVAGALNAWALADNGYGNVYYAAAVRSMTMSWSNFFFGAFDPGGYITVDKPPVFLWFGAISARIFGYSQWSILLPSAIAGTASVGLLWAIVRKYFGLLAATIAALVLALSPISVAVEPAEPAGAVHDPDAARRGRCGDPVAREQAMVGVDGARGRARRDGVQHEDARGVDPGAGVRAGDRRRDAHSVVAGGARRWRARLAVLAAATLIVSASWLVIVDSWPASSRPYIGGSTDNTVLDLALGLQRVRPRRWRQPGGRGWRRRTARRDVPDSEWRATAAVQRWRTRRRDDSRYSGRRRNS